MTGFGDHTATIGGEALTCRMRSLNHRYLEVKIRLPRSDLQTLDYAIRQFITGRERRGAIELAVVAAAATTQHATPGVNNTVNENLAKAYLEAGTALRTRLTDQFGSPTSWPFSLESLTRLPGVINAEILRSASAGKESPMDSIEFWSTHESEILEKLVTPSLDKFSSSRRDEGGKLRSIILDLVEQLEQHHQKITALQGPERERHRQALAERATQALTFFSTNAAVTEQFLSRMGEEAAFFLEKRDFEEELSRFAIHLKSFRNLLEPSSYPQGKRLEFLQQELLRETNTLGSKSQSTAIGALVIEMKVCLDRIKEQLSNVE